MLGAILSAVVGGLITYNLQKMQIDNEARNRKQQLEHESQIRMRKWALEEYAGRTAALQRTIGLVEKLYHSQRSLKSGQPLESIRDDLLQSSLDPDFLFIGEIDSKIKSPRDELAILINQVAEIDNLRTPQAMETLEKAHGLSLNILKLMVEFKRGLTESQHLP